MCIPKGCQHDTTLRIANHPSEHHDLAGIDSFVTEL
jgi:hypothetical protein